jgi:hypothetical protein
MSRRLRFSLMLTCLSCLSSPSTAQNCFPGYYCPPFVMQPYPGRIPDPNYAPPLGYPQGPAVGPQPRRGPTEYDVYREERRRPVYPRGYRGPPPYEPF